MRLGDLRRLRKRAQSEQSRRMGVSQARVSHIEHGDLMTYRLNTIARYIEALDGRLELVCQFGGDDGEEPSTYSLRIV
jgi:transcriptional regulator with XRE-family HTH domain